MSNQNTCPICTKRRESQRRSSQRFREQSAEAALLVSQGMTPEAIATELGVPLERARRLSRPGGWFANRDVNYAEVRRLYESGMSVDDIAERLRCSTGTVYRALRE